MLKKFMSKLLVFFIILISGALFLTLFNYFNLLSSKMISVFNFILPITAIFISSYQLGRESEKKGYMEGLKFGLIIVMAFLIFTIFIHEFSAKSFMYYFILLLTSILSGMIGINRKKLNA